MLIRVSGAKSGIKEYLEDGKKEGRQLSRNQLDERIILDGDLELTNQIINGIYSDVDRYLHITLAFKEDDISKENLYEISQEFKAFTFSAYNSEEYNFYAEAHIPKIKSYMHQKTGEFVERKPHIHIVIPKTNLLSGTVLNPFGLLERNESLLDAFQEYINNKYGLASPKDNRRIEFTNESDMIQRYKDDYFDGQNKEIKREILNQILERKISDYSDFSKLVAEFGDVKTRNEGKSNEYHNVKPVDGAKGINLKDYAFTREFIELPDNEKRQILSNEIQRKYEIEGLARKNPESIVANLNVWHDFRSKEIKYLNSGNQKKYRAYKDSTPDQKQQILTDLTNKFYKKYQEFTHEPGRDTQRNPFDYTYQFKQINRDIGRTDKEHRGPSGADQGDAGRTTPTRDGNGRGWPSRAFHVHGTEADALTGKRRAYTASRQYDAVPIARFEITKTLNSMRTLSGLDMVRNTPKSQVLLPPDARDQLEHGRTDRNTKLRRDRNRQRPTELTGRNSDSAIDQLSRDLHEKRSIDVSGRKPEFQQIKKNLDANRLLAELSRTHGLIVEKYAVSQATDGSYRIKVGNQKLNVSDFLTKEVHLSWNAAAAILQQSYRRQLAKDPEQNFRKQPSQSLWREFKEAQKADGGHKQVSARQHESERSRSAEISRNFEQAKIAARKMPPAEGRSHLSIAHMRYVAEDAALKLIIRAERTKPKEPIGDKYQNYLQHRAQSGDEKALRELRAVSKDMRTNDQTDKGHKHPSFDGAEKNEIIYRGKQVKFVVHRNGDVTYSLAGREVIRDHGNKLLLLQTDRESIETGLRLAQAKFGQTITVSGPRDFRENAAKIAAESNIRIIFADPKLEKIKQQRLSELASERAKKEEHREIGSKFSESRAQQKNFDTDKSKTVPDKIKGQTIKTPQRKLDPQR